MVDVIAIPQIRCDNCGFITDKVPNSRPVPTEKAWRRPEGWGDAKLTSGRGMKGYPGEELRFIDLCPNCATAAHDSAAEALRIRRREPADG